LLISDDYHIIDGHHRWKAALKIWGNNKKVKVIQVNKERKEALDHMMEYHGKEKKAAAKLDIAKRYLMAKGDEAAKAVKAKKDAIANEPT
jgi:hypothetical protein